MKHLKTIFTLISILVFLVSCKEQSKQIETEDVQETQEIDLNKEKMAVLSHMKSYKTALQNLTTEGTFELFTDDAKVFEQGKVEGTYKDYIEHHLGPELGHFKMFNFSNYKIDVTVVLPYAFSTETYNYTIVLKADKSKNTEERTIESIGVATSVLEKIDNQWKIINSHSSFKKIKQ